ncbi:hypothetical protein FMEAI12_4260004 [Parafrankia sp. Ea1.12]|nr:hypothetical protein FMEAI12_4260004 [Parafrankia sp. Ea1.12]
MPDASLRNAAITSTADLRQQRREQLGPCRPLHAAVTTDEQLHEEPLVDQPPYRRWHHRIGTFDLVGAIGAAVGALVVFVGSILILGDLSLGLGL